MYIWYKTKFYFSNEVINFTFTLYIIVSIIFVGYVDRNIRMIKVYHLYEKYSQYVYTVRRVKRMYICAKVVASEIVLCVYSIDYCL